MENNIKRKKDKEERGRRETEKELREREKRSLAHNSFVVVLIPCICPLKDYKNRIATLARDIYT